MTLLNTYVLYFFSDVLGVHNASFGTGMVAGAALIGAIVSSIFAGTAFRSHRPPASSSRSRACRW